jgi:quercetin dioxygenase-like cupin family protein
LFAGRTEGNHIITKKKISKLSLHKVAIAGSINSYFNWLSSKFDESSFSIKRYVIGPKGTITRHNHPWEHGVFIVQGNGTIRESDTTLHMVSEDSFFFIPAGTYHAFNNPSLSKPLIFICVSPAKADTRIKDDAN